MAPGLAGYFGTGSKSLTALLPSAIGIILLFCGFLAANENRRMVAMHIAVLIGLLGALGLIPQLMKENLPIKSKKDQSLSSEGSNRKFAVLPSSELQELVLVARSQLKKNPKSVVDDCYLELEQHLQPVAIFQVLQEPFAFFVFSLHGKE